MKAARTLFAAALVGLTCVAISLPAAARGSRGHYHHGPRVSFGFYGGPLWWGPGYWGPGYWGPGYWAYSAPPVVVVPSEPRVYVERDDLPAAPAASTATGQWWYWCQSAKAYYPYVSTCSEGWQRVAPQPPQAPR
jgi:hypothetical protein